MKRRDFSLGLGSALVGSTWALPSAQAQTSTPAQWQGKPPEAGRDYLPLEKTAPVEAPTGKIEVVEFFSYMCPHCNAFEPTFEAWVKRVPKDVSVRRVPVDFLDDFKVLQPLYFALEAMGLVDTLHAKVFTTIHVERKRFQTAEVAADWVAKQGVDRAKFLAQFNSFMVGTKVTRGTQLVKAYRVEGVPAMGVAGRFYTDGTMAKGMEHVLQVVDYLAGQVRRGR